MLQQCYDATGYATTVLRTASYKILLRILKCSVDEIAYFFRIFNKQESSAGFIPLPGIAFNFAADRRNTQRNYILETRNNGHFTIKIGLINWTWSPVKSSKLYKTTPFWYCIFNCFATSFIGPFTKTEFMMRQRALANSFAFRNCDS